MSQMESDLIFDADGKKITYFIVTISETTDDETDEGNTTPRKKIILGQKIIFSVIQQRYRV